jgi:hypothetical protein
VHSTHRSKILHLVSSEPGMNWKFVA